MKQTLTVILLGAAMLVGCDRVASQPTSTPSPPVLTLTPTPLTPTPTSALADLGPEQLRERALLLPIYQDVYQDVNPLANNWSVDRPHCVWNTIECDADGFVTSLVISNAQLAEFPPEISQLSRLQKLFLQTGQLRELPPEIGQLSNLQILDVRENQLEILPPEIGQLDNLHILVLYDNQLATLPPEISQLTSLEMMDLHNNPLAELPTQLCPLLPQIIVDAELQTTLEHQCPNN